MNVDTFYGAVELSFNSPDVLPTDIPSILEGFYTLLDYRADDDRALRSADQTMRSKNPRHLYAYATANVEYVFASVSFCKDASEEDAARFLSSPTVFRPGAKEVVFVVGDRTDRVFKAFKECTLLSAKTEAGYFYRLYSKVTVESAPARDSSTECEVEARASESSPGTKENPSFTLEEIYPSNPPSTPEPVDASSPPEQVEPPKETPPTPKASSFFATLKKVALVAFAALAVVGVAVAALSFFAPTSYAALSSYVVSSLPFIFKWGRPL